MQGIRVSYAFIVIRLAYLGYCLSPPPARPAQILSERHNFGELRCCLCLLRKGLPGPLLALFQLHLLSIGFVDVDVVSVDNERIPPHNTMERLAFLQDYLGRIFPIFVRVLSEVYPTTFADSDWYWLWL